MKNPNILIILVALAMMCALANYNPISAQQTVEDQYWEIIKDSKNGEDFKNYLKEYPDGKYAAIARQKANPQVVINPESEEEVELTRCEVVTKGGNLNVRKFNGKLIGSLANSTIVYLIEESNRGTSNVGKWQDGELVEIGWVATNYLVCDSFTTPPPDPSTDTDDDNDTTEFIPCEVVTKKGNLNVRTYEGKLIGSLPKGTIVYFMDRSTRGTTQVGKRVRSELVEIGWVATVYVYCEKFDRK